jgi:hypothetical protein
VSIGMADGQAEPSWWLCVVDIFGLAAGRGLV